MYTYAHAINNLQLAINPEEESLKKKLPKVNIRSPPFGFWQVSKVLR
jgi:hypothetical protein